MQVCSAVSTGPSCLQPSNACLVQEEQDPHPASVVRSVLCEELARLDNETAKLSEVREEDEAARLASLADEAARVSRLEKENASLRSELAASEKEQSSLLAKLADAHALASSGKGTRLFVGESPRKQARASGRRERNL